MLKVPTVPRTPFKRHFLKDVFIEVRFSSMITKDPSWATLKSFFTNTHKTTPGLKPKVQELRVSTLQIKDGKLTHAEGSDQAAGLLLNFEEPRTSIKIEGQTIIFQFIEYGTFDEAFDFSMDLIKTISQAENQPLTPSWLGIRKINQIEFAPANPTAGYCGEGFRNGIFPMLDQDSFEKNTLKEISSSLKFGSSESTLNCTMKAQRFASPAAGYKITLDLDHNKALTSDKNPIRETAVEMNDYIFSVFSWMISEEIREAMTK